jgi:hypothetical protein
VCFPSLLERRRTSEKAQLAAIKEAWIGGEFTHRVDVFSRAMGAKVPKRAGKGTQPLSVGCRNPRKQACGGERRSQSDALGAY